MNVFSSFSFLEFSGLHTVLLHCLSEMNLKQRSPFSYIPFSYCTSTSCHYILECDWMTWSCGPFHGQLPWSMGGGKNKKTYKARIFLKLCYSRCWGSWEYILMYIVFPLCLWSIKCICFCCLNFGMQTSQSPVQYRFQSPA